MNPLDSQEFPVFMRRLNDEMPLHTLNYARIRHNYQHKLPENIMEYSAKTDDKFLNDNLAIIEEIQYRKPKHPIPEWFRQYQARHYAKYGILNHDGFFSTVSKIIADLSEHRSIGLFPYVNMIGFSGVRSKINGAELTIGNTDNINAGAANFLICFKFSGATIGHYYDQIAMNFNSAPAGNTDLGAYRDSSGSPGVKYAETGSIQENTSFTYRTITEFSLEETTPWIVFCSAVDTLYRYQSAANGKQKSFTYSTPLPDSPTGLSNNSITGNAKMRHS